MVFKVNFARIVFMRRGRMHRPPDSSWLQEARGWIVGQVQAKTGSIIQCVPFTVHPFRATRAHPSLQQVLTC